MSQTPPIPSGPERRSAIWPWFAMPAAALVLFVTLHAVRHTGAPTESPTRAAPASAAPAQ